MGFISNQWLNRGQGLRSRSYRPVPVTIKAELPTDSWSRDRKVCAELKVERANSEYQTLHLTLEELEPAIKTLVSACPRQSRARLALDLLQGLSDTDLLLKYMKEISEIEQKNAADR